jgi:hypothetical protein
MSIPPALMKALKTVPSAAMVDGNGSRRTFSRAAFERVQMALHPVARSGGSELGGGVFERVQIVAQHLCPDRLETGADGR